jgi:hypothetical protein
VVEVEEVVPEQVMMSVAEAAQLAVRHLPLRQTF